MDVTIPMNRLNLQNLEDMILRMREEGMSASSINSYTRTLKVFSLGVMKKDAVAQHQTAQGS